MPIKIVQLGSKRQKNEGIRIGTVRRPPRGVPKERFASDDWYDVWLPALSPSAELVKEGLQARSDKEFETFTRRFRAEMRESDASRLLDLLAALSRESSFSVGCYCDEESRCHRSVLRELLVERGASIE